LTLASRSKTPIKGAQAKDFNISQHIPILQDVKPKRAPETGMNLRPKTTMHKKS